MTFINDIAAGKCPFRAPTKNSLELANIAPFKAPKVEHATKNGITQAMKPNNLSPKVLKQKNLSILTNINSKKC